MKIIYLSNFFNHHQKSLADELYKATNHDYWFVETMAMPESYKKTGYTQYQEPYLLRYSTENEDYIKKIVLDADAVICGEAPVKLIKERVKKRLLTFRDDERRYKNWTKYLKWPIYTYQSLSFNKGYLLSASAYGSRDYVLSGMKPERCFKWGYFTELRRYDDVDSIIRKKNKGTKISILWACRFIGWKHPEMAIEVARKLKTDGVDFEIIMAGRGEKESYVRSLVSKYKLDDVVKLIGPQKQECLRDLMEDSHIFLATSDQNEGWGATLNESMNSACAVVANRAIGAAPFLIKPGENGLHFKNGDIQDLYNQVKYLIDNPDIMRMIQRNAYFTMLNTWNANVASRNFLNLVNSLLKGETLSITDGPCSRAEIINH